MAEQRERDVDGLKNALLLSSGKYSRREILPKDFSNKTSVQLMLLQNYQNLLDSPISEEVVATPKDMAELYTWNVLFMGKNISLMENEIYEAVLTFPENYPEHPAKIQFTTEMFHPNIDSSGFPVQGSLNYSNYGSSKNTDLKCLLMDTLFFLERPSKQYVSISEAGQLFLHDREEYFRRHKEWTKIQHSGKFGMEIRSEFLKSVREYIEMKERSKRILTNQNSRWRSGWCVRRLLEEWQSLMSKDGPKGINGGPTEEDILIWNVVIPAPNEKLLNAKLVFPENFPFACPKVFFETRLFHPNISPDDGQVCLQDMEKLWTWTPAHTVWSLLGSVQMLLADPNPNDAVNPLAAEVLLKNEEMYNSMALQCFERSQLQQSSKDNEDQGGVWEIQNSMKTSSTSSASSATEEGGTSFDFQGNLVAVLPEIPDAWDQDSNSENSTPEEEMEKSKPKAKPEEKQSNFFADKYWFFIALSCILVSILIHNHFKEFL